jgi:hypothetical protein
MQIWFGRYECHVVVVVMVVVVAAAAAAVAAAVAAAAPAVVHWLLASLCFSITNRAD